VDATEPDPQEVHAEIEIPVERPPTRKVTFRLDAPTNEALHALAVEWDVTASSIVQALVDLVVRPSDDASRATEKDILRDQLVDGLVSLAARIEEERRRRPSRIQAEPRTSSTPMAGDSSSRSNPVVHG